MSSYALMWSGGKDSALALWRARRHGLHVEWLVNIYDRATERVRFHATPTAANGTLYVGTMRRLFALYDATGGDGN